MKKLALVLSLVGISFISQSFKSSETPKDTIFKIETNQSKIQSVDSLIKSRFGESVQIDQKFEIGCINEIREKEEGVKIPFVSGQAHINFYAGSKGSLPDASSLVEIFNSRFDYLETLGLPITPNKYFIKIVESGNMIYMVVALDEK
jgi:hypothetical protein